jgi:hypothetical protein
LCGLWEQEENMQKHGKAKNAKDDVYLPTDVGESWWDKVCQREAINSQ